MTDTTIRVSKETRQRLGSWAELRDMTQGDAIEDLLDRVDAPEVPSDTDQKRDENENGDN